MRGRSGRHVFDATAALGSNTPSRPHTFAELRDDAGGLVAEDEGLPDHKVPDVPVLPVVHVAAGGPRPGPPVGSGRGGGSLWEARSREKNDAGGVTHALVRRAWGRAPSNKKKVQPCP